MAVKKATTYAVSNADVLKATRQALAQSMGHEYMEEHGYIEGIAVQDLVTIGKDVTDTETTTDNFSKALAKQIGLIITEALNDSAEPLPMELRRVEWGALVEYALVGDFDVLDDPMFNPTRGMGATYSAIEHDAYLPQTYAKIFDKIQAQMIPMSLPIGQNGNNPLAQAFTSASQYLGYVGAVMQALANTIESIKASLSHTLACAGIAISDASTNTAVHLLTEAKAEGILASDATAIDFYKSEDALAFMVRRIREVQNNMSAKSSAYNNGAMPVRIKKDRQELVMIDNVMSRVENIVKRRSYNEQYATLDYFGTPAWQGIMTRTESEETETFSDPFALEAITSVSLSADPNNTLGYGTSAYEKANCVGLLYAKGALAYTTYYSVTTVGTTASTGLSTQFHHEAYSMAVNPVLPIVAFFVD